MQTAVVNSQNIALSGGDENTSYRGAFNFLNQEGLVKGTGITNFSGRLNLRRDFKKGQAGFNISSSVVKNNNNIGGAGRDDRTGPINSALFFDPTEPVRNEDGSFRRSPFLPLDNPVTVVEGVTSKSTDVRTFGNIFVNYNLLNNLSAKINFGYDNTSSQRDLFVSSITTFGAAQRGDANIAVLDRDNVLLEYTMNYDSQITKNQSINVLGGITFQDFKQEIFTGNISGFPSDVTKTDNLQLGDISTAFLSSDKEKNSLISYIGRINYSFDEKYLLTTTIRVDGSSRFGENNRFATFPSFALAWRLSEEVFSPKLFSELKLRGSWGRAGNQEIGNNISLTTFSPGRNAVIDDNVQSTLEPTRLSNPNLRWETSDQVDIGLDVEILEGRISGTFDYFNRKTKNLLFDVPLPQSTGFQSTFQNLGKVKNNGFEIQIKATNISKQNFTWNTTFNFSTLNNKVIDLPLGDVVLQHLGTDLAIIREGESLGSYFGHEVTGIFQIGDNIEESAQPNARPGDPIFKDINGDGIISAEDRTIIGNPFPDHTFSISNSVNYKRFTLDFFVRGQFGVDIFNFNKFESFLPTTSRFNRLAEPILNRWTPDNPDTKYPSSVEPSRYSVGRVNSLSIENGGFVRLQNVTLNYSIPTTFIRSAGVYLSVDNILTVSKGFTGSNPENNSLGRSVVKVNQNNFPLPRTWIIGLRLGL